MVSEMKEFYTKNLNDWNKIDAIGETEKYSSAFILRATISIWRIVVCTVIGHVRQVDIDLAYIVNHLHSKPGWLRFPGT